jgi:hypothetical protein
MDYGIVRSRAGPVNTYVSILAIITSIIGIMLSISIFYIIAKKSWSRLYIDLKLVTLTVIFDSLVSFWSIICSILDLTNSTKYIAIPIGCNINAAICILLCTGSINCVAVTAIERYTKVMLQKSFREVYYYIFISCFFLFNLMACTATIYLDGFNVHPTSIYCFLNLESYGGRVGLGLLGFTEMLSILIVYSVYIRIIIKRRISALEVELHFPLQHEEIRKRANSTIFKSILIIIGSTISNFPYCVITLIDLIHPEIYTPLLDGIANLCMIANTIFNCLLILGMRPDLSEELKSLFFKNISGIHKNSPLV